VRYAWIDTRRRECPLSAKCEVLVVSVGSCRAWRRDAKTDRTRLTDPQVVAVMKRIHAEFKSAHGTRRMRRYKGTTDAKHSTRVAPDLLARNVALVATSRVWTGDITSIQTDQVWLSPAIVLDPYHCEIVGRPCKAALDGRRRAVSGDDGLGPA
jgi:putative transposase